ncbi:Uncharacterized protein YjbI, contains pentapeptide repeats [Micrococcales bacterium KH10]|nr:Uncharacterized protein YjbI, contains pentapeptide repeats [Micrococcales bacterium KH10]
MSQTTPKLPSRRIIFTFAAPQNLFPDAIDVVGAMDKAFKAWLKQVGGIGELRQIRSHHRPHYRGAAVIRFPSGQVPVLSSPVRGLQQLRPVDPDPDSKRHVFDAARAVITQGDLARIRGDLFELAGRHLGGCIEAITHTLREVGARYHSPVFDDLCEQLRVVLAHYHSPLNPAVVDLRGVDLSDTNWSPVVDESTGTVLPVDLSGANLSGAVLDNASFMDTNLTDANLDGVHAQRTEFTGSTMVQVSARDAHLLGSSFTDLRAHQLDVTNSNLMEARFGHKTIVEYSTFDNAYLDDAQVEDTVFNHCTFKDATMHNTRMQSTTFNDSDLSDVMALNAEFFDCTLTQTIIDRCDFTEATFARNTIILRPGTNHRATFDLALIDDATARNTQGIDFLPNQRALNRLPGPIRVRAISRAVSPVHRTFGATP